MIKPKINFRVTIKGDPPIKKNNMGKKWFIRKKMSGGVFKDVPLKNPIIYYKKSYTDWAKQAVQQLAIFKSNTESRGNLLEDGTPIKFPIAEPIFLTCIFFTRRNIIGNTDIKLDLSNLIEAPQDLVCGNAGKNTLGKNFNHNTYKLVVDDTCTIVKNLGGSTVLYDPSNPRIDIFISSYDHEKLKFVLENLHPGLNVSTGLEDSPQMNLDLLNLNGILGGL